MSNDKLQDMLENAVRLGANDAGAAALSAYKKAVLKKFGTWPATQPK